MISHLSSGDFYTPFNKPALINQWLKDFPTESEYVLVQDADFIFRGPILPSEFNLHRRYALSEYSFYMPGVSNELADKHIPEV